MTSLQTATGVPGGQGFLLALEDLAGNGVDELGGLGGVLQLMELIEGDGMLEGRLLRSRRFALSVHEGSKCEEHGDEKPSAHHDEALLERGLARRSGCHDAATLGERRHRD